MNPITSLYLLVAFAFFVICDALEEHTGKLLFHSADNDPKDNEMTLIEVQRFFLLFDLNGDGDIKANEFLLAWKQHFGLTEKQAKGMLKLVDKFAPKNEITEIEITSIYNLMDDNGDGSVSEPEFLNFWADLDVKLEMGSNMKAHAEAHAAARPFPLRRSRLPRSRMYRVTKLRKLLDRS